jgi:UDP-3-O-[3-hydroxymyristoyl] glucosamine N-acyltransferase
MVIGYLELGDDVGISAGARVSRSVSRRGQYRSISPLEARSQWRPQIKRLARLAERVAGPEKKLGLMEKTS